MDYEQFRAAVESVGGNACGLAAIVLPDAPIEEIDGYAVAVLFPTSEPICFVTQVGSAPRGDLQKLRSALSSALVQSRQPTTRSFGARIRSVIRRILK